MGDFELFIGYLGNGATVCNKAVQEHGDYKQVAHITVSGNIRLYVKPDYIPKEDMKKIEEVASRHKRETEIRLDKELNGGSYYFERILDDCCNYTPYVLWQQLLTDINGKKHSEKVKIVKDFYMKYF